MSFKKFELVSVRNNKVVKYQVAYSKIFSDKKGEFGVLVLYGNSY